MSLIVTSHQHFDHWQALEAVAAATGAPTAANEIDAEPLPVKPDRLLANGDTVRIGELTFDVIHLRGHTPGSIALALDGPATGGVTQLFTGDCLFPGGVGKTWQPGDFEPVCSTTSPTRVFDVYPDSTVSIRATVTTPCSAPSARTLPEWRESRLVEAGRLPTTLFSDRCRRVHDQHVDLGPPRHVGRHRAQQPAGDGAQSRHCRPRADPPRLPRRG